MAVFVPLPFAQLLHPVVLLQHQTHYGCLLGNLGQYFVKDICIEAQLDADEVAHDLRRIVIRAFGKESQPIIGELSHFETVDEEYAGCDYIFVVIVSSFLGLERE